MKSDAWMENRYQKYDNLYKLADRDNKNFVATSTDYDNYDWNS